MTQIIDSIETRTYEFFLAPDGRTVYAIKRSLFDGADQRDDDAYAALSFARAESDPEEETFVTWRFLEKCDRLT